LADFAQGDAEGLPALLATEQGKVIVIFVIAPVALQIGAHGGEFAIGFTEGGFAEPEESVGIIGEAFPGGG
jgi:hypothetical protein